MRMTRCIIGLASALMLAASVNVMAEPGERVATVEDYPTHMQAMPVVLMASPFAQEERLCSLTADMIDYASTDFSGAAANTLQASKEVTPPTPAGITSKPAKA